MKMKEKMIKRQNFFEDLDALRRQYKFDWSEVLDILQVEIKK